MKINELEKHLSQMTKEELEQNCLRLINEINNITDRVDKGIKKNAKSNRKQNNKHA